MRWAQKMSATEAGGHVHLRRGDVAPQRFASALESLIAEFRREVCHRRGHIHGAHGMPHDAGLLSDGDVRLVILVGPSPEGGRILAARKRFLSEIVRLTAPLVDEIGCKIEAAAIAGQSVKLDQRELDLLMPAIAALLPRTAAKCCGDVIDVTLHDVEHLASPGGAKVGDGAFEQMARVIELVVVAQVRPALLRLAPVVPAVEIAEGRLGAREIVDDGVNLRLDVGVAPMGKRVSSRLDPLADIRVPEHLHGKVMAVPRDHERGNRLRQFKRIEDAHLFELLVLARNRVLEHGLEPLAPERAGDADIRKRDRGIGALAHDCFPLSAPGRLAPLESRMTREHGNRRTPFSARPPIISMSDAPASRPKASRFMSMLVSGGRAASVITPQLSKPTTATSSGTPSPISRSESTAPRAI